MTEEQKAIIQDLRFKGEGYKKIAQELGLSENTIKSFCRRTQVPKIEAEPVPAGDACEGCGKPIEQTTGRKHKRFCSDACRCKWWNSHLHLVQRKAVYRLK
ncbi:MAG: sigma-70 family RNA polymerase sigma factor, partial [Selenomonadaceae bacterium]|nr:sigma-70 family RNA polymerase sigma factor [Selenomonadaceae bacterium]